MPSGAICKKVKKGTVPFLQEWRKKWVSIMKDLFLKRTGIKMSQVHSSIKLMGACSAI